MKRILLALAMLAAPISFTGCTTTDATREVIIYYSFKDTQTVVHRAYDVFAERVVLGKVSASKQKDVEDAYVNYQDLFRTAFAAAQLDLSKPTPDELRKLAEAAAKDGLSIATYGSPGEVALQITFNSARAGILSQADEIARLRKALERDAVRFDHCAVMIQQSFNATGTLRAERSMKAQHYALEAAAALSPPHADREVQND